MRKSTKATVERQKPGARQRTTAAKTQAKTPTVRRKKNVRAPKAVDEGAQQMLVAAVTPFSFEGQAIRAAVQDGQPWFASTDVCDLLELRNSRQSVARLDDDEKGVLNCDTLGGEQALSVVNESGLYRLIFRSRKLQAKAFRRWVTRDVLPQIRKTGSYNAAAAEAAPESIGPLQVRHEVFDRQLLACALTTTAAYWHMMLQVRAVGDDQAEVLMLNKLERVILDGSILGAECLLSMQRGESAVERV